MTSLRKGAAARLDGLTALRAVRPLLAIPTATAPSLRAVRTHELRPLAVGSRERDLAGLTALRALPLSRRLPASPSPRPATSTHQLQDLGTFFTGANDGQAGPRRVRVCVVDTMLQTGGAEWFAAQLAMAASPVHFEFLFITFNSKDSPIAKRLIARGFKVICATSWRRSGFGYQEWLEEQLFELLDRLNPDLVFFSSQYLYEQLPHHQLRRFPVAVRISNFHADELASADFSAADRVICCTDEQYDVVRAHHADKAVLIRTGVDLELFKAPERAENDALKKAHGLEGKKVVLFVGRLGSPLKRVDVFQEVVRAINAVREDVAFHVVGYFGRNQEAEADAFHTFAEAEGVTWEHDVPPWDMPSRYRMADILLSTSAEYEGLSNTVLQALASGLIPVVTASAGMHELVVPEETGFLVRDGDAASIASHLQQAADLGAEHRRRLATGGRARVREHFDFAQCAVDYQRTLLGIHREQPARVCITDGSFGTGGAEWLAALLILNSDPTEVRFEMVVHRAGSPLLGWLAERGVRVHEAPAGMSYDRWRSEGVQEAFRRARPDVVMPCTITSWPAHDPFYRLLMISQNAADAAVLTPAQYEQADFILCVSEEVRECLDPEHRWKMMVLRNSIDVDMFAPRPEPRRRVREELGIGDDEKVVLWCGRMHERRKRLDVLRDVIADMRDDESVRFLVLGYFRGADAEEAAWREFMAAHPSIAWVAGVVPWKTPDYYAAADAYLSTSGFERSDFEGLSLTSVQALAAELPIVTTMSGGQQEVVDEGVNGRLVENGDVAGLVEGLRDVLASDAARVRAIRRSNRAKALASFDIREHARVYGRLAQVLKGTVGVALATDPGLPSDGAERDVADATDVSGEELRRAASFLRFTWPLLPEGDDAGPAEGAAPRSVAHTIAQHLDDVEPHLAPGSWVSVPGVGPADGEDRRPSAASICALLDHLEQSFPRWSACERHGSAVLLQKRTNDTEE